MATLNPEAAFDCLSVGIRLERAIGDFRASEVHLFCYLSCLLSLYRGWPVSDWHYQFAGTKGGSPFSEDIDEAINRLSTSGLISRSRMSLKVTSAGNEEYTLLLNLGENAKRDAFIEGACSSVLAMPVGGIRDAILHEPELRSALLSSGARRLLDGPAIHTLYSQFAALSEAVGVEVNDLMVPATVWLTYLVQTANSNR